MLDYLQKIFDYAVNNQYSPMYRDLYGLKTSSKLRAIDEWEKLPLITRDFLQSYPFHKRIFIPFAQLDSIKSSSGSSGKGVLITPRCAFHDYKKMYAGKPVLVFERPVHQTLVALQRYGRTAPVINGDNANLELSISIASKLEVKAIEYPATILSQLEPLVEKYNLTNTLEYVFPTGERMTEEKVKLTQKVFPKAQIHILYGASELPTVAGVSLPHTNQPDIYQPTSTHYWEILDDNEKAMSKEGDTGRLVLTTLLHENLALPLLRYDIGDMATISKASNDYWNREYRILGRKDLDYVTTPMGQIRVDALEQTMRKMCPTLVDDFQCEVNSKKKPGLIIKIKSDSFPSDQSVSAVVDFISKNLRTGPTRTYQDGVDVDLCHPIEVTLVEKFDSTGGKFKKLIIVE